jgi:hypothetical protein
MTAARTYQRRIRALKDLIASMQWVRPTWNGAPSCAGCGEMQHHGCAKDCPAAAVTRDYGEPENCRWVASS